MENLFTALQVIDKIYDDVKEINDKVAFMAFLGTLTDQWAADHGLDSKATCELLSDLVGVQKDVHNQCGMMAASEV